MMSESAFSRFWNLVKPPPPGSREAVSTQVLELRRRQRRLIAISLAAVLVLAAAGGIFSYLENAPQRAEAEFQDGMKSMRPGKYPDAVKHFTRALDISPQRADAFLNRADAHRALGETDAALADYRASAELDPSSAAAHNGIALIFLSRNDSRHALEELNKSILLQPTIDAYYQRGQILEAQGEHQKAIDDYNQGIALDRGEPYLYLARATAKASLGDAEGAHADRELARSLQK